jgi:DNA-binding NtrC family response regulator
MDQLSLFVVDENAIHRNMIRLALIREGYTHCQALPNLDECDYLFGKGVIPDYIIIDFLAIARNPQDFLDRVENTGKSVRIIIFTDHDDPLLAEILLERGVFDYILKQGPMLKGILELQKNLRFILKSR